ncbi:MAG: hemolysin family protein [Bacilli bacterium]|nr:hemolysin family protein [Bacilli bacterium]
MNGDSGPLGIGLIFILIIVLTLINAFFASAEMAVVSVRNDKIKKLIEQGNKQAKTLARLTKEPTKFLSTIQVAITLAGYLSSATAGSQLSGTVVNLFSKINITMNQTVAMILVTLMLSYFSLVFGELVPKRIALRNPEKVALRSASTIKVLMIITSPFVRLLSGSTNLVLKLLGYKKQTEEEKVSEDQIRSMIITGHIEGLINQEEKEMLDSIFKFDDKIAESIMTPRTNLFALNVEKPVYENLKQIINQGFSRIPVYDGDIDNIIGILHVKDLLKSASEVGFKNIKLREIMREPYFVPSYIKINILFRNMKDTNNQIAILIDEYGGSVGIVTIEDLVEEIVGNIYDEYDEDKSILKVEDDLYIVDGGIPIHDLNRTLQLQLDENNGDYDTLGGLIINILGFIPTDENSEEIEHKNIVLKINKLSSSRIDEVLLRILPKEEKIEEEDDDYEDY